MKRFTLLELLIVISVLGILMTILIPSLTTAKKSAMMAVSISNLGQIYTASMGYTTDNGGKLIRGIVPDENFANGTSSELQYSWDDCLMEGYLGSIPKSERLGRYPKYDKLFEVFKCPFDNIDSIYPASASSSAGKERYRRTYALNAVSFNGSPVLTGIGDSINSPDFKESMFMAQVDVAGETIFMSELADYKNQVGTGYRVATVKVNNLDVVNTYEEVIDGRTYKHGIDHNHHNNGFRKPYLFVDGGVSVMSANSTLANDKHLWRSVKQ